MDVRQKSIKFVWDGTLLHDDLTDIDYLDLHPRTFGNGTNLLLGHTNDYGFPLEFTQHYMHGHLSDVNVWATPLPLEDLIQFTSNCQSIIGSGEAQVLDWRKDFTKLIVGSKVKQITEELDFMCAPQLDVYMSLFPYPMDQESAKCK